MNTYILKKEKKNMNKNVIIVLFIIAPSWKNPNIHQLR